MTVGEKIRKFRTESITKEFGTKIPHVGKILFLKVW